MDKSNLEQNIPDGSQGINLPEIPDSSEVQEEPVVPGIIIYPSEILKTPCKPVNRSDPQLRPVVDKMTALMVAYKGLGLAAPQVGYNWQLIVLDRQEEQPLVLLNPVIEPDTESQLIESTEGCISIPGVAAKLHCRWEICSVVADQLDSEEPLRLTCMGQEAIVLQHEVDHLNGITLFDRMGQVQRMLKKKQYLKRFNIWKEAQEKTNGGNHKAQRKTTRRRGRR